MRKLLLRIVLVLLAHVAVVVLALLGSGCTVTYIHRDAKEATAWRASIGTDQTLGELSLTDGEGATLKLKRHVSTQTDGIGAVAEGITKGAIH